MGNSNDSFFGANADLNSKETKTIIGIDFGTSGIGFGYYHGNQPASDIEPRDIKFGHFEGQSLDDKMQNEIILDDKLEKVLAFGKDCNIFLCQNKVFNFHHFRHIKMNLYHRIYKIKALNSDKEVDIEYIIKLILIETKKKAIEYIRLKNPNLDEKTIHYVITVPAIWDIKSKEVMIKASLSAGLIRKDDDFSNFFALEPEAASIYFGRDNYGKGWFHDYFVNGINNYILLDYGSGTVDIVSQKVEVINKEIKFKELYPPVGGDYGSNKINEYFMDRVIKPLIGEENINKIKNELLKTGKYSYWIEFENDIETKKKRFNYITQSRDYFEINCQFFKILKIDIQKKIEKFNDSHKCEWRLCSGDFNEYEICFPYQILLDFMEELASKVKDLIVPILETVEEINYIIFTGGASLNPIFFQIFENFQSFKYKNFSKAENPEAAIALGSVLFALNTHIINPRKAKYTFGIEVTENWDDSKHKTGGIKYFNKFEKKFKCINIFSKFITKGDELRPDQVIEKSYLMTGSIAKIKLYRTEEIDVKFCDEKNLDGELKIWKFGEYIIDVGNDFDSSSQKTREVIIKMKMGGTFITSEAIYCKTNKRAFTECLFE